MAVADGHCSTQSALLLFTPREAARSERRVMNANEVQICFAVLGPRERLVAKLAILAGMRLTPYSKDNCWRRHTRPKLAEVQLEWATFQVMRRTHATLMNALGVNGKLVADQLGHSLDVNQNVYTQSPVESRLGIVNQLEESLIIM
jgi:integrase